jgi:hypothetical protein
MLVQGLVEKKPLRPLRFTFSFYVFKMLEGKTNVGTENVVYTEMTGSTEWYLFTVYPRHHLSE